jgi:ferric-dicitrate binding protein FerR (iron transport regulator)
MSDTFEHIETLIARSLENNLTPAEQEALQTWLEQDDTNRRYYNELCSTWEFTGGLTTDIEPDIEDNWARFNRKLQVTEQPAGIIRSYRYIVRVAAAVLLLGGAATAYFMLNASQDITVQTAANEKNIIVLSDGTKAFMNHTSTLRYARNFEGGERAVYLEGEAFFDVTKDDKHPFVVYTQQTRTQVLGTSFDVKAYAAQPAEVSVLSGKVAVSGKEENAQLILTQGKKVVFRKNKQLEEDAIANQDFIAWKENILDFNDELIGNVTKKLEAYYDVKIVVEDNVAGYHIKSHFSSGESLEQVLNTIALTANASWTKEGNVYRIK